MTAPSVVSSASGTWGGGYPLAATATYDATGTDCLVVFFQWTGDGSTFIPVCTYNGVAATLASLTRNSTTNLSCLAWVLKSPASGSHTVSISSANSANAGTFHIIGLTGTATVPMGANSGSVPAAATSSISVTTTAADSLVLGLGTMAFGSGLTLTGSPTPTTIIDITSPGTNLNKSAYQAGGSSGSSITFTATTAFSFSGAMQVEILAAGAGGPSTYTGSNTEAVTAAESNSATLTSTRSHTETVTASDSNTSAILGARSVAEAGSASDAATSVMTFTVALTETGSATDLATKVLYAIGSLTEGVTALDTLTALAVLESSLEEIVTAIAEPELGRTLLESVTATDAVTAFKIVLSDITEAGTATVNSVNVTDLLGSRVESLSALDSSDAYLVFQVQLTETLFPADNVSALLITNASFNEVASANDGALGATLSDPLAVVVEKNKARDVSSSDTPAHLPTLVHPGQSLMLRVVFRPTALGLRTGVLSVVSSLAKATRDIPLRGMGIDGSAPQVAISDAVLSTPAPLAVSISDAVLGAVVGVEPSVFSSMLAETGTATVTLATPELVVGGMSWLVTDGRLLRKESSGEVFRLKSVNWSGMEGILMPTNLWARGWESIIDDMAEIGFNSIRLPICEDITWAGRKIYGSNSVNPTENADLWVSGATPSWTTPQNLIPSIEVLDKFIAYAKDTYGMRVVLDMHCLAPNIDNQAGTGGKWYTTSTPGTAGSTGGTTGEARSEAQWIAAWEFLANRYKNEPAVCGFDLINEPHNCTWDRNASTGVVGAYERCAKKILDINPNVLIICEGVAGNVTIGGTSRGALWGGNLSGVTAMPVVLQTTAGATITNKLVYSPHEYAAHGAGAGGAWLTEGGFPGNLPAIWEGFWGFISTNNIAPLWIGEFGGNFNTGQTIDLAWISALATYTDAKEISWAYWVMNGTGISDFPGILTDSQLSVNAYQTTALAPMLTATSG